MRPPDFPEQRPADMGGVTETRKEFANAIRKLMLRLAVDTYHERVNRPAYTETLGNAHDKFFNTMKGATNIHKVNIQELIDAEISRQQALYTRLNELKPFFDSVKPLDPSGIVAPPYWEHGPSHGCNVEINGARFYAAPRVPCSTNEYITVKQAPVPANIIMIDQNMILMLPYGVTPSEETRQQFNKILDASGKITEEGFKEPIHVRKNYLWVHSEEKLDERLIIEIMKKYKADAFMVGYPGKNLAIVYTGLEESIERLWQKLYFDWGDMGKRYAWYE
ncbi:hypothetical protein KQH65_09025 [archaeon]|nr:hypothetical protein [archaeon]